MALMKIRAVSPIIVITFNVATAGALCLAHGTTVTFVVVVVACLLAVAVVVIEMME